MRATIIDGETKVGYTYPYINVSVTLTDTLGRVCKKHPLDVDPSDGDPLTNDGVSTAYTQISLPKSFSSKFDTSLGVAAKW